MRRLVYDVPRWHIYLHREERWWPLVSTDDAPEKQLADEVFSCLYADEPPRAEVGDPDVMAKFTQVHAELRRRFDFEKLRERCRGDVLASAEKTWEIVREAKQLLVMMETPEPEAAPEGDPEEAPRQRDEDAQDVAEGLDQVKLLDDSQRGDHEAAGREEKLKSVGRLAAKFKRALAHKQKVKVRHGADEVIDIVQGDDLARLLPTELLRLADDEENEFVLLSAFRDFVEKRCLQYCMESTQPEGRGPIVLCIDRSRSMSGARENWAAAVALAVLDMAHRQNRDLVVLGGPSIGVQTKFDARVPQRTVVKMARDGQPADQMPEADLFFPSTGDRTLFTPMLDIALTAIERAKAMKRADIILIADGGAPTTHAGEMRSRARRAGATVLGIGVGDAVAEADLKPWCDEVRIVNNTRGLDDDVATALFSI